MKLDYFVINDTNDLEVKLENKENIILDIKGKDYSVFLKINDKNELLTRFVRKIDSEDDKKNITDSQQMMMNTKIFYTRVESLNIKMKRFF